MGESDGVRQRVRKEAGEMVRLETVYVEKEESANLVAGILGHSDGGYASLLERHCPTGFKALLKHWWKNVSI